ncbi:MAG: AI-2E family transporter [Clostridia bacterium]|nr:AI-2E family transporter [Clostridia bacterium]
MNNKEFKREYLYKGITAFLVVAACVLFAFIVFSIGAIWGVIKRIFSVLSPVIFGLVIAYLVNPMVNFFDVNISKLIIKKAKNKPRAAKFSYYTSVLLGIIIFTLIIIGFLWLVIPQLIESLIKFATMFPQKLDEFSVWGNSILKDNDNLREMFNSVLKYEKNWLSTDLSAHLNSIAGDIAAGAWSVLSFFKDVVLGIIFAIYLLFDRDRLIKHCKKALVALFSDKTVGRVLSWFSKSHKVFSGFINGKLLDSLIISVLCFIGTTLLNIPYALLVTVIVGITNFIPVFGPYIGGIPSAVLVTIEDPKKGLYFIIFIILLQTLDGNFIGPKILGDRTGLSNFWVMFAIVVGGGLFNVLGMLVGVPTFAVIYYAFALFINYRLKRKNKPVDSDAYSREALEAAAGGEEDTDA